MQLLGRRHQQTPRPGLVGVRVVQRGAAGAQRPVGHELHGADGQQVSGVADHGWRQRLAGPGRTQHHVQPRLQGPLVGHRAVHLGVAPLDARVVHHREPELRGEVVGQAQLRAPRRRRSGGGMWRATRSIALSTSTPVGVPSAFADDAAAVGVLRGAGQARCTHRRRVHPRGVPVDARQVHRVVRRRPRRAPRPWATRPWPSRSGPSRARRTHWPLGTCRRPGPARARRSACGARRAPQLHLLQALAEIEHVPVGVVQAGDHGAPTGVDHLCGGPAQRRGPPRWCRRPRADRHAPRRPAPRDERHPPCGRARSRSRDRRETRGLHRAA